MGRVRGRLSFANVMSVTALFVALGGSAYAVGLGPNSVGTKELRAQAVERHDLGFGSVASNKVEDGSLLGQDFAPGELPQGPQGERGAEGTQGPAGSARAYGRVSSAGALSKSKNVVGVTQPPATTGIYCIALDPSINPAETVLITDEDFFSNSTAPGQGNHSHVEWFSQGPSGSDCPSNTMAVFAFLDDGDGTDNNDAAGNSAGDSLTFQNQPFAFMVP